MRQILLALLLAVFPAVNAAQADTLIVDGLQRAQETAASRPLRGMSMSADLYKKLMTNTFFEFFDLEKPVIKKLVQKKSQNLTCEACGLYKNCKSPKLELRGEGKKKIFILGEFPSETDDKENFIFTDLGNRLLITQLKDLGIDFRKDCWAMNAVNCYLPEYKFPTDKQIACCRERVLTEIKTRKPVLIIALGLLAIKSVLTYKLKGRILGIQPTEFIGLAIPDLENNCYIVNTYSPNYILSFEFNRILLQCWTKDIKNAIENYLDKKIPRLNFEIKKLKTIEETIIELKKVVSCKIISFDYETTGIKPHKAEHKII